MAKTYGFDQLFKSLDNLSDTFEERATHLLERTGNYAVSQIKPRTPVDTGLLQSSMRRDAVVDLTVFVGTSVYYAIFVEGGHRTRGGGYVPGVFMIRDGAKVAERRFIRESHEMMIELTKEFRL